MQTTEAFREVVWDYYRHHGRRMPWRDNHEPYRVMVSEIMLQQTQVERVKTKFIEFMNLFPTIQRLANAPLSAVLAIWSGLGYNRRAKFLWEAARMIEDDFHGEMPQTVEELMRLPGIGPNTAGAIATYAYNQPTVFIETNIRTVYFHHFFADSSDTVTDRQLREVVAATLDHEHPREWYWALMDYGAYLKKTAGGRLQQSHHYKKQSPLKGSTREMRGNIVRSLIAGRKTEAQLRQSVEADERFDSALAALIDERLVMREANYLRLTDH